MICYLLRDRFLLFPLTIWEQETVRRLQLSAITLWDDFGIKAENFKKG